MNEDKIEDKKQSRPEWTEYFLDIAKAVGRRSTCLRRRYGAIIVKDKIIMRMTAKQSEN